MSNRTELNDFTYGKVKGRGNDYFPAYSATDRWDGACGTSCLFSWKYQVILPDLCGHGKSDSEAYVDYFNESAKVLLETMDYLEIDTAHVAGCSLGALVGFKMKGNE